VSDSKHPTSEPKKTEVYAYHDEGDKILDKPLINAGKLSLGNAALPSISAPSLFSEKSLSISDAVPDTGGLLSLNMSGGLFQQDIASGKLDLGSVAINTPSAPSLLSDKPLSIGDATTGEGLTIGKPSGTKSLDLDFRLTPPIVKGAEEITHTEEAGSPGVVDASGVAASSGSQDETPKSESVSLDTPAVLSLGGSAVTQENKGLSLGLGGNSSLVASMSLNQDLKFPSKNLEANSLHYEKQDLKNSDPFQVDFLWEPDLIKALNQQVETFHQSRTHDFEMLYKLDHLAHSSSVDCGLYFQMVIYMF
jgi:hypothetical protein